MLTEFLLIITMTMSSSNYSGVDIKTLVLKDRGTCEKIGANIGKSRPSGKYYFGALGYICIEVQKDSIVKN